MPTATKEPRIETLKEKVAKIERARSRLIIWLATQDGEFSKDEKLIYDKLAQAGKILGEIPHLKTEKCDECGDFFEEIIGCPDGAEICQECFDSGAH